MNTRIIAALTISAGALVAVACGSGGDAENPVDTPYTPLIDPANFTASTVIDNPYLPYVPGTSFIYEGREDDEIERIEVTVTSDIRRVMGIDTLVVHDVVSIDGEVIEDTFDWFAQDNDGNVWYMGEDSKEFEDGKMVSTEGSWEAGVSGALPGIVMLANPLAGVSYRQEFFAGEAEDMAQVRRLGETVAVPLGTYDNVLVVKEWNPLEPGVVEDKYYAPGIGVIREQAVKGGSEVVELLSMSGN